MKTALLLLLMSTAGFITATASAEMDSTTGTAVARMTNTVIQRETQPATIRFDPMDEMVLEVIPLRSVDYETVETHCRPVMTDKGTMTYMESRNVIIVRDTRRSVKHIKDFLAAVDKPAVNVRIDVSFARTSRRDRTAVGADIHYGKGSPGKIVIRDGKIVKPRGVSVYADVEGGSTTRNTRQFLVVRGGSSASLWVGKEIPDPSWLNNYRLVPAVIVKEKDRTVIIPAQTEGFVWRNVGASLRILPRYMDNNLIDVEVYPEISYVDGKGMRKAVRVEGVSTRLTMQDGQTLNLGGVINAHEDFYANLFGPSLKYDESSSILDMNITARVLKPGTVPKSGVRSPKSEIRR
jgi:hypothetical protein